MYEKLFKEYCFLHVYFYVHTFVYIHIYTFKHSYTLVHFVFNLDGLSHLEVYKMKYFIMF